MRKIVLWSLALCGPYIAAAQKDKNICACSGQALWGTANPQSRDLFDPALVKAARYKEATITLGHQSRGKGNMLSNTGSPYLYARYQFNDSGFVTRITEYYNGAPRYVSQYQRNTQNVVTSKLFSAADSAGNINTASYEYFAYQYYYEKGRLVQTNVIDKAYSDKPDILSRREYYEYDDGGREVRKRYVQRQRFSPARTDTTVETTRYSAKGDTAITTSYRERKAWLRTTTLYGSQGQVRKVWYTDLNADVALGGYELLYDTGGRLQKLVSRSGMPSECPDASHFTNSYFYGATGLPDVIRYEYGQVGCLMKVAYK